MSTPYSPVPQVLRAPDGTKPGTVYFWLIVVLSALICIPSFIYLGTIDLSDLMRQTLDNPGDPFAMYGFLLTPAYAASLATAFIGYVGTAVLALFDWRTLRARGVPSPFHWATSLVPSYGTYIYVIGRAVVVRRRTGRGLAPLWVFVALSVLTFVISIVLTVAISVEMFNDIRDLVPLYR